jgi:cysteine desulfurase
VSDGEQRVAPSDPVYLDHNATTPPDPQVVAAVARAVTDLYGNPANGGHWFGRRAARAVQAARRRVARLLGAAPREIVFTAGATESCNLAIKGVAEMYRPRGDHLVTCLAEHAAVREPCRRLENAGFEVTWLRPDEFGRLRPQQVEQAVTPRTVLLSVMAANNVVGTLNPIAEIGRIAKAKGVIFHCDATQAAGKIPLAVNDLGVDLLSLSAHKLYGPKGVGALYVRGRGPRVRLACQMDGGGQERGLRSGTLNVAGIVGAGLACEIARRRVRQDAAALAVLRDRLHAALQRRLPGVALNGHPTQRLANTLNVSFAGVEAGELMRSLPAIAASVGAACTSGADDPHYVLRAMGLAEDRAAGAVRFSLGRGNTVEQIDQAAEAVVQAVVELRRGRATDGAGTMQVGQVRT